MEWKPQNIIKHKDDRNCFKAGLLFLLCAVLFQLLARYGNGFGQWYATTIYPLWQRIMGWAFGFYPFSVVEFGLYFLLVLYFIYGIRHIRQPLKLAARTVLLIGSLLLSYTMNCGINYYRNPFSSYLDLEIRPSSKEELYDLCEYLTNQVNLLKSRQSGNQPLKELELGKEGIAAMKNLGEIYPGLAGFYPLPKAVTFSEILSYQYLTGIYAPFTVEANYNRDMTSYNKPLTICHELSHLKGFMREDEANFIGYLACVNTACVEYQYSGFLMGWIYAGNALADVDMDAYSRLYQRLDQAVIQDLSDNNRFWDKYEGKVAEAANKINDTYLKMNSQEDGVKSYGRVVDLMLAYYRENTDFNVTAQMEGN